MVVLRKRVQSLMTERVVPDMQTRPVERSGSSRQSSQSVEAGCLFGYLTRFIWPVRGHSGTPKQNEQEGTLGSAGTAHPVGTVEVAMISLLPFDCPGLTEESQSYIFSSKQKDTRRFGLGVCCSVSTRVAASKPEHPGSGNTHFPWLLMREDSGSKRIPYSFWFPKRFLPRSLTSFFWSSHRVRNTSTCVIAG